MTKLERRKLCTVKAEFTIGGLVHTYRDGLQSQSPIQVVTGLSVEQIH